jgi:hypothetical protein
MQDDSQEYVPPQLTVVGDVTKLVRGLGGLGLDFRTEAVVTRFEFEDDESGPD